MPQISDPVRGILWMLAAAALFAAMGSCIRFVSSDTHPFMIAFFRSVFGLALMLPWFVRDAKALLTTSRHGLFFARGLASTVTQISVFTSLAWLPMADAVALNFTAPLFGAVLAVFMLGEKMRLRRWTATLVGFCGVLVILRPGFAEVTWVMGIPVLGALSFAFVWMFLKRLTATEPTERILSYFMLWLVPLTFIPAAFVWIWPSLWDFAAIAGVTIFGNMIQFAMTRAYKSAEATLLMPFDFARLPFIALVAYFGFGQPSPVWTWVGAAIIFSAAFYITWREAQIARSAKAD